jgi:hypothetical protein
MPITFTATSTPIGITLSPSGDLQVAPTVAPGSYQIEFSLTDGTVTTTKTVTLVVSSPGLTDYYSLAAKQVLGIRLGMAAAVVPVVAISMPLLVEMTAAGEDIPTAQFKVKTGMTAVGSVLLIGNSSMGVRPGMTAVASIPPISSGLMAAKLGMTAVAVSIPTTTVSMGARFGMTAIGS